MLPAFVLPLDLQRVQGYATNAANGHELGRINWIGRLQCSRKFGQEMEKSILTIKWGSAFSAEHVNILFHAARDNSTVDFQFVCLTDDPKGLDGRILSFPIPMAGLSEFPKAEGAWPKVCLFHPDLCDIMEQVLFLDIDTVITQNIDPFFEDPGNKLRMLSCGPRWKYFDPTKDTHPASGVMAYNMKHHVNIFDAFQKDTASAYARFVVEQAFVGAEAHEVDYFPLEWIQSFKYHLRRQYLVDLIASPLPPAKETRMVAFHGYPRPHQVADRTEKWARFPRCGLHRPAWILSYWNKYKKAAAVA